MLKRLELTPAARPQLFPDEVNPFSGIPSPFSGVADPYNGWLLELCFCPRCRRAVLRVFLLPRTGYCVSWCLLTSCCYRKFKVPDYQNGYAYLTTHRACYVDNAEPRKYSVAVELSDVDRYDLYVSIMIFILRGPK